MSCFQKNTTFMPSQQMQLARLQYTHFTLAFFASATLCRSSSFARRRRSSSASRSNSWKPPALPVRFSNDPALALGFFSQPAIACIAMVRPSAPGSSGTSLGTTKPNSSRGRGLTGGFALYVMPPCVNVSLNALQRLH